MSLTNWTNESTIIQGDISISLRVGRVYSDYVELDLYAFSSKWERFDVALEYRLNSYDKWNVDIKIISALAGYIDGNKFHGLYASNSGHLNKILWKYKDNYIQEGDTPEIRARILPVIKQFSEATSANILTKLYGKNKVDVIGSTNYHIIGINNYGQYIATDNSKIYILEELDSTPLYTSTGFSTPLHAVQIYSDKYIVADTNNNRVVELDFDLSSIVKTHSMSYPQFVDYSEPTETLLVTGHDSDVIEEISWDNLYSGFSLWSSSIVLNNPSSATYSRNDLDRIIISDTDNDRIVLYDRLTDEYTYRGECTYSSEYNSSVQVISLNKPFRAYQLYDNQICIVEKEGVLAEFNTINSSSSSSLEYSSSSSSSLEYSSSSSSSSFEPGVGSSKVGSTFKIG